MLTCALNLLFNLNTGVIVEFIEFGYGTSTDENSLKAGAHAASDALKMMKKYSEKPNIVFLYSSPDYDPEEVLNGVKLILGNNVQIVGGSSKFQICGNNFLENGVSIGILGSKYFSTGMGVGLGISINPKESGKKAVKDAVENLGMLPKLLYVITDFCRCEEQVLKGIVEELGVTIPIFGGVSSDNFEFEHTYQYGNDVYLDSIVCVAFGGDIVPKISYNNYEYGENSGKLENIITKSEKRSIEEIGNISAVKRYIEISGYKGTVTELENDPKFYLSHPLGILDTTGDIHLKGPISIKNKKLITGSNISNSNELKIENIDKNAIKNIFKTNTSVLNNTQPHYEPALTFCNISSFLSEINPAEIEKLIEKSDINPFFGSSTFGEISLKKYGNYSISMCSFAPDLVTISAKEGIHMFTKHPATKETLIKIHELGGSVKVEELAKSLGIHRRSAYDRIDPLLKYGFIEKDQAVINITEFGKLLLKFEF